MEQSNFMVLFNQKETQRELFFGLKEQVSFELSMKSVSKVVVERNRLLQSKGLVDLSIDSLIQTSAILAETPGMTEKNWLVKLPQLLEIFYELRQMNQPYIEDEIIIQLIGEKYNYYDEDLDRVAGYFETNFDLEGKLS